MPSRRDLLLKTHTHKTRGFACCSMMSRCAYKQKGRPNILYQRLVATVVPVRCVPDAIPSRIASSFAVCVGSLCNEGQIQCPSSCSFHAETRTTPLLATPLLCLRANDTTSRVWFRSSSIVGSCTQHRAAPETLQPGLDCWCCQGGDLTSRGRGSQPAVTVGT